MCYCEKCKALICDNCGHYMSKYLELRDCTELYFCANCGRKCETFYAGKPRYHGEVKKDAKHM